MSKEKNKLNAETARKSAVARERDGEGRGYEGMTLNKIRSLCRIRGIKNCTGAGMTKKALITRLKSHNKHNAPKERKPLDVSQYNLSKLREVARESGLIGEEALSRGAASRDRGVKHPYKREELIDIIKKGFEDGEIVENAELNNSVELFNSAENRSLRERILDARTHRDLMRVCERQKQACIQLNWGELLREKNTKVFEALIRMKSSTSWQSLYERMVDFFSRFENVSDLQFIRDFRLYEEYGDVWIALVQVYPKMRAVAVEINDLHAIGELELTSKDASSLYSRSGSRKMAEILFQLLPKEDKPWLLYLSLSMGNKYAIRTMLDRGLEFDFMTAIEASVLREESLGILLERRKDVRKHLSKILKEFRDSESHFGMASIVREYPSEIITVFQPSDLRLLARGDHVLEIGIVLESDYALSDVAINDAINEAILYNAMRALNELIQFVEDNQYITTLIRESIESNRLDVVEAMIEFIDKETIMNCKKDILEAEKEGNNTAKWLLSHLPLESQQ